ncbi:lysosomal-associated transmembrane protein 4A-like [Artemia franciscana]|uniref:Lysosomal-associated transmembrane protein n=1 Tax=Artemia franciscana TaxID=6661 RepID=A0AA88IIC8_ARTSF|nr:hypothetical protein QYM36_002772 [Artemia franciscana]KAK2722347.1 hypothetical protein QYM36_002772 [Artemia franciscana]
MRIKLNNWMMFSSESTPASELIRDTKRWRCIFFCHVKTATMCIGLWHMAINILTLSLIFALMLHSKFPDKDITFQSENQTKRNDSTVDTFADLFGGSAEPRAMPVEDEQGILGSLGYSVVENERPPLLQDELFIKIATASLHLIVAMMVVQGCQKVSPILLLPFIAIQAGELFISCLTYFGFIMRYPDNLSEFSSDKKMQDQLSHVNPQYVKFVAFIYFTAIIIAKGAILNIVWTCNKYLTLCKIVSASAGSLDAEAPAFSTVSFPSTDLPDYATAMNDPRFAKSPLFPVPPPPYSAIVTEQEEQAAAQTQGTPAEDSQFINPSEGTANVAGNPPVNRNE